MITYLDRYICEITDTGCHVCTSHKPKLDGRYYSVKFNSVSCLLHRLIFEKYKHKIEDGMIIRHTCNDVLCINPDHLIQGTHKDNSLDAIERDRNARGVSIGSSKLTKNQVIEILNSDENKWILAKRFNINERTVRNIRARRYWKHIDNECGIGV